MTSPSITQNPSIPTTTPKIRRPIFQNKAKWRCLLPSDLTFVNKYKPKMIRTIEISQLNHDKTKPSSFRKLRKAFIDNKTAFSLKIQDEKYKNFAQVAHHISSLFNSSNHYTKLVFNCFDNRSLPQIPSKSVVKSLARLGRCKELHHLYIKFNCKGQTKNEIINHLSSQLRGLKKLKYLDLDGCILSLGAQGDPNEPLFKFRYPQCLSSLALYFQASNTIKDGLVHTFISNLQRCKQLKSLKVDAASIPGNTLAAQYLNLAPLFKNASKTLKALTFTAKFNGENMNPFLEDFSHLKNLTTLDLHIGSDLTHDEFKIFVPALYNHLASFPDLKTLNLRVSSRAGTPFNFNPFAHNPVEAVTKVLPIEFHLLFPPLQSLTKLEELKIDLPHHAELKTAHFQSLSEALQHLHCLKKLEFAYNGQNITPEDIFALTQGFKSLHSLKDLSLMLAGSKLQPQFIETVLNSLANLLLENLSLNLGQAKSPEEQMMGSFPNFNMEEFARSIGMPMDPSLLANMASSRNLCEDQTMISAILSSLSSLSLLKHLNLNLAVFKFSTHQAEQLHDALKNMKQLESLKLDFPESEDFKSSLSSLKEMPKISSLKIVFPKGKIGDEEVRHLVSNLQASKSLEVLKLNFEEADQLTDDSIRYFSSGLKDLVSLKDIHLTFGRKGEFSDEVVFGFFESLRAMKGIEKMNFEYLPAKPNQKLIDFINKLAEQSNWRAFTGFPVVQVSFIG